MDYAELRKLARIDPAGDSPGPEPCLPVNPCDEGLDPVPLSDFFSLVGAALDLERVGFDESPAGRWTRIVDTDIVHALVVRIVADGDYELVWGVDFPALERAHRDTPDLYERVHDYVLTSRHELERIGSYRISSRHGRACVVHDAERVWRLLRPVVFAWWEGATRLDKLADRAHRQVHRNWVGAAHNPAPDVVESFLRNRM